MACPQESRGARGRLASGKGHGDAMPKVDAPGQRSRDVGATAYAFGMIGNPRVRFLAAPVMGVALLIASMSPAVANPAAEKAMIKEKDVPTAFGSPTSYDFDTKIIGKTIGICDNAEGQTLVSVPAPPTQYLVDIETQYKKTYTEIFERVYRFDTTAQAESAFAQLKAQLATCNGTSSMTSQTPSLTQTTTTGTYPQFGDDVFWVNNTGTWSGGELKKPSRTVIRANYAQVDDAIIEVAAYINGRGKLTAAQARGLNSLSREAFCTWSPSRPGLCIRPAR